MTWLMDVNTQFVGRAHSSYTRISPPHILRWLWVSICATLHVVAWWLLSSNIYDTVSCSLQRARALLSDPINDFFHPPQSPLQVSSDLLQVGSYLGRFTGVVASPPIAAPFGPFAGRATGPNPIPNAHESVRSAPRTGIASIR